jgi:hypothetical protein
MADDGQEQREREEEQGSPLRRFLRRVAASVGSVVANPMLTVWGSARNYLQAALPVFSGKARLASSVNRTFPVSTT